MNAWHLVVESAGTCRSQVQEADNSAGRDDSLTPLGRTQGTGTLAGAGQRRLMVPRRAGIPVPASGGCRGLKTPATNPRRSRLGVRVSLCTILPAPALTFQGRKLRHSQPEPGPKPRLPLRSSLRYHLEFLESGCLMLTLTLPLTGCVTLDKRPRLRATVSSSVHRE